MLTKHQDKTDMNVTVRVKVLRGFQGHEIGSIIDIPKGRYTYLADRGMVVRFDVQPKPPVSKEKVEMKSDIKNNEPEQNRAVGLKNSPNEEKKAKRKK